MPAAARPAADVTPCRWANPTLNAGSGRRNDGGNNFVIRLRLGDYAVGEFLGGGRDICLGLDLDAGNQFKPWNAAILVGRTLGRSIALAIHRDDVDKDWQSAL